MWGCVITDECQCREDGMGLVDKGGGGGGGGGEEEEEESKLAYIPDQTKARQRTVCMYVSIQSALSLLCPPAHTHTLLFICVIEKEDEEDEDED